MKQRTLTLLTLLALLVPAFNACNKHETENPPVIQPRKDIILTRSQQEMVKAGNDFAFNLLKKTAEGVNGESFVISPLSVTYALGMVDNGAAGETRQEINSVLGYEGGVDDLNAFCRTMMEQGAAVDPSTVIEIANAAIVNQISPLKPKFTQDVEEAYQAKLSYMDFAKDDVVGIINKWCEEKTHGMISRLLDGPLSPQSYAHFLNAVYFKGIWSSKFKKSDTRDSKFKCEDGNSVTVGMMHQEEDFLCSSDDLCQTLTMVYGNGAYRMTVLLPHVGVSLHELEKALTTERWEKLLSSSVIRKVDVKFPSFETEYKIDFSDVLKALGMPTAFTDLADFSLMSDLPLCIGFVMHKARIKVDESGTEAAAVTDVGMEVTSPGPGFEPQKIEFHADHPFLYAITECSTGAIFFLGEYTGK